MTPHHPARVAQVWTPARRGRPTGKARGDWLVNQLPLGMLEDDFFVRFVRIFQELATSYLDQVDNLVHQLDPSVAPASMVRYLGRWLGVDTIDPDLPDELQRRIVREWATMLAWRGTRRGLKQLLELVSLAPAEVIDGGGVYSQGATPPDAGLVIARVLSSGWAGEEDLIRLVQSEVPVATRTELWIGDRRVWTTTPEAESPHEGADDA